MESIDGIRGAVKELTAHMPQHSEHQRNCSLIARVVARTFDSVSISAVPDGLDALLIYQQSGADLVVTNHEMPVLSGLSLIERLRVLSATLPIIMISAHPNVEPLARALGVTHFLLKPFLIPELVQVLTSVLSP